MRIALLATLAFSAVWLVALRPKPVTTDSTPGPTAAQTEGAQSAPGQAAEQADKAVEQANEATAKNPAADAPVAQTEAGQGTASKTARPAPIDVKAAGGKLTSKGAKAVLADINDRKVVVLLFWDRNASDDRAVRSAVTSLCQRGGKVAIHVAPIGGLAGYEPITRGVPVVTSPTTLIVDRARRARSVTGLTTRGELDEIVTRALRVKP
jgi:hypothetical protein